MKNYDKLVIVVPDIGMTPGKVASQVSHVTALVTSDPANGNVTWESVPTIITQVDGYTELYALASRAEKMGVTAYLYMDSRPTTEDTGGKITALAFFCESKHLNKITGKLDFYTGK